MKISLLISHIVWLLLAASRSCASRILFVTVAPLKSHSMMHNAIVRELLARGHEVTLITNYSMKKKFGANYTEVLIDPILNVPLITAKRLKMTDLYEMTEFSLPEMIKMTDVIGLESTEHALKQPKIAEIFNRRDTENVYDLLIVQQFHNEAFLALAVKYNIPVITYGAMGFESHMSGMMGVVTPWSFVPHIMLKYDDKMNFWERLTNAVGCLYEDLHRHFVYSPQQDALVKKYLSHLPIKIPSVSVMERNISLMLINAHVSLTTPRPMVPAMVSVGGIHIYPAKPLPEDIQKFIDEATHGVIYFSLGTNVMVTQMPPDRLKALVDVFASIKQRVLFKVNDAKNFSISDNVLIKEWMPQNDILAHPNVKVFITHGGLFGIQEAIYHGVPMLGIPLFLDQHLNVNKITKAGYGLGVQFRELTTETLNRTLTELLENPAYKENLQRASRIYHDHPQHPRDAAIYWIEYVIRHKGARHLRSAALDLAWYELYLLDVVAFFVLVIAVAVVVLVSIVRCLKRNIQEKVKVI